MKGLHDWGLLGNGARVLGFWLRVQGLRCRPESLLDIIGSVLRLGV